MADETVHYMDSQGKIVDDHPTGNLRWDNGVLQQEWRITEWVDGMPDYQNQKKEWREVEAYDADGMRIFARPK